MSVYLAIIEQHKIGEVTLPFCSEYHRSVYWPEWGNPNTMRVTFRDDTQHEFDEICADCGAVIPAFSPVNPNAADTVPAWMYDEDPFLDDFGSQEG